MLSRSMFVALALATTPVFAGSVAPVTDEEPTSYLVRVGKIYTGTYMNGEVPAVLEPGELYVVDGKIAAIGSDLDVPKGTTVYGSPDSVLMPGVVLATSSLAGNASGPHAISANQSAADGFDPYAQYQDTLLSGITTAYLSPGRDRLVSGAGAVAKLHGSAGHGHLLASASTLEINLVRSALGTEPLLEIPIPPSSDNPIKPATPQLPSQTVSQLLALREAVALAKGGDDSIEMRALAEALESRRPLRIVAQSEAELLKALDVVRELKHPTTLVGAASAGEVADQLSKAGHPVVVEIGLNLSNPVDAPDPGVASQLTERGLKVAVTPPHGSVDMFSTGALARRGGMSCCQVVAAMTRVPAELLGVADRVGSLEVGKDADFLVLNGEPFHRNTHVVMTIVEGKVAAQRGTGDPESEAGVPTVLRAGHVLIGDGTELRNGAVLIADGKIADIGSDVAVPPGARVIDLGPDGYLTPGFIDCNSQLELDGDRGNLTLDLDPVLLVAAADEQALDTARAGVTTALVQAAAQPNSNGTRVVAVKTAGQGRDDRIVSELAAIKFSWRGTNDPVPVANRFKGALGNGKKYHDSWVKYFEELKKWEEEQAKKGEEEAKKAAEEAAKKAKEEEVEEEVTEKKADPITGKWECEISGGPMPEPQQGEMNLKLTGSAVSGTFSGLFGDASELSGTFSGNKLSAEITLEQNPQFRPTIELTLTGEDRLEGNLLIGDQFTLDLSANRTEKTFQEVVTVTKRKKKGADGRPAPPTTNDALEPYRALYSGECAVLLDIDEALSIKYAVPVFAEQKLPLVLMNADGGLRVVDEIKDKVKGVVVPSNLVGGSVTRPKVPAADYAAQDLDVAFQSATGRGRGLPLATAWAVRQGLSPAIAIQGLTSGAAKMFGIDDRVGTLATGMDADVLAFSGDPFELTSRLESVFVSGVEVDLEDDE